MWRTALFLLYAAAAAQDYDPSEEGGKARMYSLNCGSHVSILCTFRSAPGAWLFGVYAVTRFQNGNATAVIRPSSSHAGGSSSPRTGTLDQIVVPLSPFLCVVPFVLLQNLCGYFALIASGSVTSDSSAFVSCRQTTSQSESSRKSKSPFLMDARIPLMFQHITFILLLLLPPCTEEYSQFLFVGALVNSLCTPDSTCAREKLLNSERSRGRGWPRFFRPRTRDG